MTKYSDSLVVEQQLNYAALVTTPTTQAVANSTLSLAVTSNKTQYFTGSVAGQIVKLPDATTLTVGQRYELFNQSSQTIAVQDGAGVALFTLSQTSIAYITLQTNGSAGGGWVAWQVFASSIASGIITYQIVSTTVFASSSTTDVLITGFAVTPQAGTYAIWFNIATESTSGTATNTASIYKAAVQIADSERPARMAASNSPYALASTTISQFSGTQTCDVRVRTSAASQTVRSRTIILIRTGP